MKQANPRNERKNDFWKNMMLLCGSIIVCFLVLEGICRIIGLKPQIITVEELNDPVPSNQKNIITERSPVNGLYVYTRTGTRLKRNSRCLILNHQHSKQNIEIVTNSLGYRHPELEEKKPHELRILVLGDSITLGDYAPYDKTYPSRIEQYLEKESRWAKTYDPIQVINAGVGGIDLQNEFAILMETGLSTKPDIVLVGLFLNDACMSQFLKLIRLPPLLQKSYLLSFIVEKIQRMRLPETHESARQERKEVYEKEFKKFINEHQATYANWRTDPRGFNRLIAKNFPDWGFAWTDKFWEEIDDIISMMKAVARENGFEVAVVLFPSSYQVKARILRNEPQQQFETHMSELGIKHLDVLPLLRDKFKRDGEDVYYDQCHMKPDGDAFVGKSIAQFLVKSFTDI